MPSVQARHRARIAVSVLRDLAATFRVVLHLTVAISHVRVVISSAKAATSSVVVISSVLSRGIVLATTIRRATTSSRVISSAKAATSSVVVISSVVAISRAATVSVRPIMIPMLSIA